MQLDGGFHQRLEFLARVLAVKWLADAIARTQEDVDKHLSWVENAFGHINMTRSPGEPVHRP